jgi:glycosyltransferase involved in cell wall biosynthesis
MPSREEGLGLVAVEAQLCEAPVVAYASGGLTDVVMPEHGGVLVPTGDIGELAAALARVLDDPVEAARDGARARRAMLERFSPDAVARQYAGWYAQAVARKAR